jgi:hypothetical protein
MSSTTDQAARAMAKRDDLSDRIAITGQGDEVGRRKNALKSELLSILKIEEQHFAWPIIDSGD